MKKFQLPLVLFFILIAIYLFGDFLPVVIKELFLSISLILKSILLFILPFKDHCIIGRKKHIWWHSQVKNRIKFWYWIKDYKIVGFKKINIKKDEGHTKQT